MTYYIVYKTENKINGNYYIGKHATNDLNDGYLGSGKILKHAIRKYGKENFERTILLECKTENEAYEQEFLLVMDVLDDPMCYNIVDGGHGFTSKSGKIASDCAQEYGDRSYIKTELFLNNMKNAGIKGADVNRKNKTGMFGFTITQRKKWGKKSSIDKMWITNGITDTSIKKSDIIPHGFYRGRTNMGENPCYRKGMKCWTNGDIHIFAFEQPGPDFVNGMLKTTPTAKMAWWNNGKVNKRSHECPGDDFVQGRLKWKSKIVICPHCNKKGGETAMKRHHFDHCKKRGNNE